MSCQTLYTPVFIGISEKSKASFGKAVSHSCFLPITSSRDYKLDSTECSLDRALVTPCRQIALPVTPLRLNSESAGASTPPTPPPPPAMCNTSAAVQQRAPRPFLHRSSCYQAPPTNPVPCFTFAFPVLGQPESYAASARSHSRELLRTTPPRPPQTRPHSRL